MKRTPVYIFPLSLLLLSAAGADVLLFPYIASSPSVATVVSIVNKDPSGQLFLEYIYKPSTLGNTEVCQSTSRFQVDSSTNDLVSFEANGAFTGSVISALGGPLFNDPAQNASYAGDNFTMGPLPLPRRAFLIADDNDNDGENLYGEALILETSSGAAWGYRAFNAAADNFASPIFDSSSPLLPGVINDVLGEALDQENGTDVAPVTLLPPSEWETRFFVTPLGDLDQRGCENCSVVFNLTNDSGGFNRGVFDRDGAPLAGSNAVDVVCVTGISLSDALPASVLADLGSQGGWAYVDIDNGSIGPNNEDAAVVLKLEFNKSGVQFVSPDTSNSFNGVVNSAVWIRNRDNSEGLSGF